MVPQCHHCNQWSIVKTIGCTSADLSTWKTWSCEKVVINLHVAMESIKGLQHVHITYTSFKQTVKNVWSPSYLYAILLFTTAYMNYPMLWCSLHYDKPMSSSCHTLNHMELNSKGRAEQYYRFSDISRYCANIDILIFCYWLLLYYVCTLLPLKSHLLCRAGQ